MNLNSRNFEVWTIGITVAIKLLGAVAAYKLFGLWGLVFYAGAAF